MRYVRMSAMLARLCATLVLVSGTAAGISCQAPLHAKRPDASGESGGSGGGGSGGGGSGGDGGGGASVGGESGHKINWACSCQPACDCLGTSGPPTTLSTWDVKTNSLVMAMVEYDACDLAEVFVTYDQINVQEMVFNKTTGEWVGGIENHDLPQNCPCGPDSGTYYSASSGRLPQDDGCVASSCALGVQPLWLTCDTLMK
jgi:hypothetical protein